MSEEDILDVFQETVIIYYRSLTEGKLEDLEVSVKTYIYAIGKNLMLKRYQRSEREVSLKDNEGVEEIDLSFDTEEQAGHIKSILDEAIDSLGNPCSRILTLFYYYRYSMEAIKLEMGYNHEEVARTQKSRCLKKLRALVNKKDFYG